MAQRNRRRARGGGPNTRKNGQPNGQPVPGNGANGAGTPDEVEHPYPELVSGEEALAEAQLAFGRPDLAETPDEEQLTAFEESESGRDYGPELEPSAGALSTRRSTRRRAADESTTLVEHAPKVGLIGQLTGFLWGAWRELQRVQWPDRRQVFQATGVVLGFVLVAGAFLAVASLAAQKVVNLILYGHG